MPPITRSSKKSQIWVLWLDKFIAVIALINLILVFFDLSYVPFRSLYFIYLRYDGWQLTNIYDPIKGIEPHRDTEKYLNTVEQLKKQVIATGLSSPQVSQILAELRELSTEMIESNPFAIANQTGNLERIKNNIRKHINNQSAKQAFEIFWSQSHLNKTNWNREINFYNQEIAPLLKINYYRHLSETGNYVDNFWKLDIWFILPFFLPDFLIRTWLISRRHIGINWLDAMLWRWYDIFLLIPFFRWLRILPVTIRLHEAKLISLQSVKNQFSQGFVATIAEDITEVVVIKILNKFQGAITEDNITKLIDNQHKKTAYIDLNNQNELMAIITIFIQLTVDKILPESQQEIEVFLEYNLQKALQESNLYQGLKIMPGSGRLSKNLCKNLAQQIYQFIWHLLNSLIVEDAQFNQLLKQLIEKSSQSLQTGINQKDTKEKIAILLQEFLEEVKINYVKNLSQEDIEVILEQTRALHQIN